MWSFPGSKRRDIGAAVTGSINARHRSREKPTYWQVGSVPLEKRPVFWGGAEYGGAPRKMIDHSSAESGGGQEIFNGVAAATKPTKRRNRRP